MFGFFCEDLWTEKIEIVDVEGSGERRELGPRGCVRGGEGRWGFGEVVDLEGVCCDFVEFKFLDVVLFCGREVDVVELVLRVFGVSLNGALYAGLTV